MMNQGILTAIRNWLAPLPDMSLPNLDVRTSLLKLLLDMNIDLGIHERKEQLKNSELGKVVLYLSKCPDETGANKRLAAKLIENWVRKEWEGEGEKS